LSIVRQRTAWLIAVPVTAALVVAVLVVTRHSGSDELGGGAPAQVLTAGRVAVIVESQEAWDRANSDAIIGTGFAGPLGLVNGRCFGFVQPKGSGERDIVIVWPPGTTVERVGDEVRITSEGKTVRLGDQISGGADLRRDFPELDAVVPPVCRDYPRVPIGLSS
jgi:hypothetical protein